MAASLLVLYGSYRSDRPASASPATWSPASGARRRGRADRRQGSACRCSTACTRNIQGEAPAALETLAGKIRAADAFVFVTGEYNWGVAARPQEPDRPLPGGVVLAAGGDRQLLGGPAGRGAVQLSPGTASCPRWGWWSISQHVSGPITPCPRRGGEPTGEGVAAWSAPFRASPTTSPGGRKRRAPAAPSARPRLTDRHPSNPRFMHGQGFKRRLGQGSDIVSVFEYRFSIRIG